MDSHQAGPAGVSLALANLVLGGQRTGAGTWIAQTADGHALAVWRAGGLDEDPAARARWRDALGPLTQLRDPHLVPVLAVGERDRTVWVVSELDCGRPLRHVLAVAALTPEQAATVTVGILAGLEALHAAERWHGALDEGAVQVGRTGSVRLSDWGLGPAGGDPAEQRRFDREAALRLLSRVRGSVRQPGPRKRTEAAALLEALDACQAGAADPAAALAGARREAGALLSGGTDERAARELGALVAALEPDRPAPTAPPRRAQLVSAAVAPSAIWRPRRRRWRGVAAALVLLLVLVAGAVLASRGLPARRLSATSRPSAAPSARAATSTPLPSAPPTPAGPRSVPALAPTAAGPITAVEIQPLQGSCAPGAICPVQVTVRLQPQPSAEEVRWSFRVFDRCTGATSSLPGTSVTALAGWPYVYGTSWPALPDGHLTALVAVTEAPAAAASPAVLAGGSGPC